MSTRRRSTRLSNRTLSSPNVSGPSGSLSEVNPVVGSGINSNSNISNESQTQSFNVHGSGVSSGGTYAKSSGGNVNTIPNIVIPEQQQFTGLSNSESAADWLRKFNQISDIRNYSNQLKCQYLPMKFSPLVEDWFNTVPEKIRNTWSSPDPSVETIQKAMIRRFTPASASIANKLALRERKQLSGESVDKLVEDLFKLKKQIDSKSSDKIDMVELFVEALLPNLQEQVRNKLNIRSELKLNPLGLEIDVNDVIEMARNCEAAHIQSYNKKLVIQSSNSAIKNDSSNYMGRFTYQPGASNVNNVNWLDNESFNVNNNSVHQDRRLNITSNRDDDINQLREENRLLKSQIDSNSSNNNYSNNSNYKRKNPIVRCANCNLRGHTDNECYRLYGFPDNWSKPLRAGQFYKSKKDNIKNNSNNDVKQNRIVVTKAEKTYSTVTRHYVLSL